MSIAVGELHSHADERFASLARCYRADIAERNPEDPPVSDRFIERDLFGLPADRIRLVYVAEVDNDHAGFGFATFHRDSSAEIRLAEVEVIVAEHHRRTGVATALLDELVPALVEAGQNSIIAYACADLWPESSVGLCERYGLTHRQEERCSRAQVAEIDDELMQRWIDASTQAASGYRIEQWEGPCPDHLVEPWCIAAAGMEDAPLDDVDFEHVTRQPEQQVLADQAFVERGYRFYRTLALSPDGKPAGLTALFVHHEQPEVGHQDDTAVLAAHRGHGIGRWLKAANYQQVMAAEPGLSVIETYNAQSNPWMLDINIAMAFKPHLIYSAYQGSIDDVLATMKRPG